MKSLTKPLTVNEINELKETEDLYHSNMFRMQIDETLKEVNVKNKHKLFIEKWMKTFTKFLNSLPSDELTHLLKHQNYPLKSKPIDGEKKLQMFYKAPVKVSTYGSHASDTSIGIKSQVDVLLIMPNEILKRDDYINQNYFHKKALYLLHIAQKLEEKNTLGGDIKLRQLKNDPMKFVITIVADDVTFAISAIPTDDFFKLNRFIPKNNNIKFRTGEVSIVPTPHYNFQILYDCTTEVNREFFEKSIGSSENVRNAIKLLKIWFHQRQFDEGFYSFGGFIITYYIIHLLQIRKIYPTMSCYQIVRLFWNQFGHSKLDQAGISLCQERNHQTQPSINEFHQFYDLVIVDSTGYCNIMSLVSLDLYKRIREECLNAIKMLDNKSINSFHQLFLTAIPFYVQYDQILSIKYDSKLYDNIIERFGSSDDKINFHNLSYPHLRKMIMAVLRRGLGNRVSSIVPISQALSNELDIGIILNPDNAYNIVEKGPQSNEPEAEDFRKFWGNKAEIRRFKDGSITESVLWCRADAPIGEKRLICRNIIMFLLKHHFHIIGEKVNYVANQMEITIKQIFNELNETNEERSLVAIKAFDELSKQLRALNDLPLEIVSVLGIDPIFRYTDVTPPLANGSTTKNGFITKQLKGKFRAQKILNGIIQLSPSGKWPDDLDAMKRIKAAFYIEIARKMEDKYHQTTIQVMHDCIEAIKGNLVFRLKIVHPKEVALAKEELSTSNNLTKLYKTNEDSLLLEFQGSVLPKMTSSIHGLHHQFPSYGPSVAIAKRWLYSHMIDTFLWPDECTELIIAEMYIKMTPMEPAIQPQTAFLRFLHRLAQFDPQTEMIVVNFNDELPLEKLEEIEGRFSKSRKTLPALCIVTSCDFNNHGIWTSRAPSTNILQRVKILAQSSIALIADNYTKMTMHTVKDLFTTSFDGYDLIIQLNEQYVRKADIVLHNFIGFKSVKYEKKPAPAAGINFVENFLLELREAFEHVAVFFHNPIGGSKIGMLWKPIVAETREFSTSHVNGCKLENDRLRVNTDAIIRDIQIMGDGIINSIEIN